MDFLTEDGAWKDWGACPASNVEQLEDHSYALLSDGNPFLIRCIADHGEFIVHVDGDGRGEIHFYRIVPIPPPGK